MGISAVKGIENTPNSSQMSRMQLSDAASKKIENDLKDVQREKQALNSNQDLSVTDAVKIRQELQQEKSKLDVKLRQREEELRREQQKEALKEELRASNMNKEDENSTENKAVGNTDSEKKGISNTNADTDGKEVKDKETKNKETQKEDRLNHEIDAIITADSAIKQTRSQQTVIARMEDAIVIKKGEMRQDKRLGMDVDKKEAAIAREEKKVKRAASSEFSSMKKASDKMEEKLKVNPDGTVGKTGGNIKRENNEERTLKAVFGP